MKNKKERTLNSLIKSKMQAERLLTLKSIKSILDLIEKDTMETQNDDSLPSNTSTK